MSLTSHLHLAPKSKKEYNYTSTPLCAIIAGYMVNMIDLSDVCFLTHNMAIRLFVHNNNNNIYLLQLGCYPVAVVILHVNKHEVGYY